MVSLQYYPSIAALSIKGRWGLEEIPADIGREDAHYWAKIQRQQPFTPMLNLESPIKLL